MGNKNDRIIVALDGISKKEALRIAKILKGKVWGFKVNDLLFEGVGIITELKKFGNVFADAKLHDIPNTVANSTVRLAGAGADMITVHGSGGVEMMKAAKMNAGSAKILAVTVLTSAKANKREIIRLVRDTIKARADGIVCSGHDLSDVLNISGSKNLFKIVPGIRPAWYKNKDDQKRSITPDEAIKLGADYLVIGRPILNSKNPLQALLSVFET